MNRHASASSPRTRRLHMARIGAGVCLTAVAALAVWPGTSADAQDKNRHAYTEGGRSIIELNMPVSRTTMFNATITAQGQGSPTPAATSRGLCPPVQTTHSSVDFDGANVTVGIQAGFVAQEAAAASYTIDPLEFPIVIRTTDWIIARETIGGTVTTEYTLLVWQGTPATGTLVASFSSDDLILPHAVMQPNEQALNVQITVDPGDPEQVVVEDDGTATFSIGYRIDVMNNPPFSSCNFGFTPAPCCPHNTQSNAFPTTDSINPDQADNRPGNWILCRSNCGLGSCPGGWHRFDTLGAFELGGDWNLRVTYEPFDCPGEVFGACCFSDGTCSNEFGSVCTTLGGSFQGDGTDCAVEGCPDPVGACCFSPAIPPGPFGATCAMETESECATRHDPASGMYSVWSGPGVQCTGSVCPDAIGACCFDDPSSCVDLSFSNCGIAGGTFAGVATDCATLVCDPFGACCMPDGSCMDEFEVDCVSAGGVFQGHDILCVTVNCPQPTGACCLSNGACIIEVEANCTAIPGASWAGMNTTCPDTCVTCPADIANAGGIGPDGNVNVFDLLELLANWGTGGTGADIAAPTNTVDVFDLLDLLAAWGSCN